MLLQRLKFERQKVTHGALTRQKIHANIIYIILKEILLNIVIVIFDNKEKNTHCPLCNGFLKAACLPREWAAKMETSRMR